MTQSSSEIRAISQTPPRLGEWLESAAGVFWSRVALPFRLNHVNVYLIDDGDSWNVIDTGIANNQAQETRGRLLAGRMAGRPVSKILITPPHPDHVGLASWLGEKLDAEVVMSGTEY